MALLVCSYCIPINNAWMVCSRILEFEEVVSVTPVHILRNGQCEGTAMASIPLQAKRLKVNPNNHLATGLACLDLAKQLACSYLYFSCMGTTTFI